MKHRAQQGAALAVGLLLLTLAMLLALASSDGARIARVLAQNESFRENAANAAGSGIEMAIRAIVNSPDVQSVPARMSGLVPDSTDGFDVELRFLRFEAGLPQEAGERLQAASFEILSTGHAARGARDRQRAGVLWVVDAPEETITSECLPAVPRACHSRGALERLSWQRVPLE